MGGEKRVEKKGKVVPRRTKRGKVKIPGGLAGNRKGKACRGSIVGAQYKKNERRTHPAKCMGKIQGMVSKGNRNSQRSPNSRPEQQLPEFKGAPSKKKKEREILRKKND